MPSARALRNVPAGRRDASNRALLGIGQGARAVRVTRAVTAALSQENRRPSPALHTALQNTLARQGSARAESLVRRSPCPFVKAGTVVRRSTETVTTPATLRRWLICLGLVMERPGAGQRVIEASKGSGCVPMASRGGEIRSWPWTRRVRLSARGRTARTAPQRRMRLAHAAAGFLVAAESCVEESLAQDAEP